MRSKTCLIVTGASSVLGKAVIVAARSDPSVARVICTYRGSVPEEIGPDVLTGLDLVTDKGIAQLSGALKELDGCSLALVHCAGLFPPFQPIHRTSLDAIGAAFDSNTRSFIGAIHAVLPEMRRRMWGRIVAFSSHTASQNYPYAGAFNIAKAGLEAAVQVVANENARFGISANTLLVATLQSERERALKPNGRFDDWVAPEDVAKFALTTALSETSHLNGSSLHFWRYSASYFGTSILERNALRVEDIDPE